MLKWREKNIGGRKPSLKLTLKWHYSCDDSQSCEQQKKHVLDKFFEKIAIIITEPEYPSVTGKVCFYYISWVAGVYVAYIFDRNSGEKSSQIEC